MNKLFISGSVGAEPEVLYTPRGQKILMFPVRVDEGSFSIDVVYAGGQAEGGPETTTGRRILVAGMLTRTKTGSRDVLKVKASKILPMEE
ncbi:MAG: Single-strand binding protein family [Deltaproteobacteria bacterium]|nr:Single-strand binding protein family [Deltaproteobacteria bacterium]